MKKLFLSLLAFVFMAGLVACGKPSPTDVQTNTPTPTPTKEEIRVMTYNEFMSASEGDLVCVEGYIAAKQSFWDNAATTYLVDGIGQGYLLYSLPMTEDEFNNLYKIGTRIRVSGTKAIYAAEHEINGSLGVTIEVIKDAKEFTNEAVDISSSVKSEDIFKYQNAYFKATVTVKEYSTTSTNTTVSENKAYGIKGDEPTDDLYILFSDDNGNVLSACIEAYLTGPKSDVYKYVLNDLKVGQKVTVEGYLYWWNGANPHIVSITPVVLK